MRLFSYFLILLGIVGASIFAADLPANWPASYPEWWYDADPAKSMVDVSSLDDPGNQSPILQGQLLHMADIGIKEIDEQLAPIGGAGFDINVFKDPNEDPSYYSPVAIGQLKFVVSKFYNRFAAIGYHPGTAGWNPGIVLNEGAGDSSLLYPWKDDQTPENMSIALIGQAKHTFAWNIEPWIEDALSVDSDGDGLPDFWENYWGDLSFGMWLDSDGDGLFDSTEYFAATDPTTASSLNQSASIDDSDADLIIVLIGRGIYGVDEAANIMPLTSQ